MCVSHVGPAWLRLGCWHYGMANLEILCRYLGVTVEGFYGSLEHRQQNFLRMRKAAMSLMQGEPLVLATCSLRHFWLEDSAKLICLIPRA